MVSWTWPTLPSLRFRFELLEEARWRRPGLRRSSLPVAVILNRLATAFFVLRRAMDFGMGVGTVSGKRRSAISFCGKSRLPAAFFRPEVQTLAIFAEATAPGGSRGGGTPAQCKAL